MVIVVLPPQVEECRNHSCKICAIHREKLEIEKKEDSLEKWTIVVTCMYHCSDRLMVTLAVFLNLTLMSQNE